VTLFYIFRLENMAFVSRAAQNIRGENMTGADFEPGGDRGLDYSFRPSAFGAPRNFRLLDGGIAWEIGRRSGVVAFDRIDRVRMSYRPATMQTHRFLIEIWSEGTPRLDIVSSSWKSMVEQIDQGDAYRAFAIALHTRLVTAARHTRFETGMSPFLYWPGITLFVVAALSFAGLTVRILQSGAALAALLIAAFLLLFLWQAGNIFYRNRPGSYRPDALPPQLLPRVKA
jgi:hypothetical protein